MTDTRQVKLSCRINPALFVRLEDRRFRVSKVAGRRVSARELVEEALRAFLDDSPGRPGERAP